MKTIELVFKCKETATYINEVVVLTEYTEKQLQKEIDRILQNNPLLQKDIYYDMVNKILQILYSEEIIRFCIKSYSLFI